MRTYSELITIPTFLGRYEYLKIGGRVGEETFGYDRWLNQQFYQSPEWRMFRNEIIIRDLGRDLAMEGWDINDRIYIHHLNPITKNDIIERNLFVLMNPENSICCSFSTHNAIHYGDETLLPIQMVVERTPYDTCPWRVS